MTDYDFNILQYGEFENLTRDLLQAQLNIYIESFTPGKDGGIDFRFGLAEGGKCVIQVKRYKDYPSLLSQLRKEAKKVDEMKPERYILSTSVGLTPLNKDEIKQLFGQYIKTTEDIYGRTDLNNLLAAHQEIEERNYKLWLTSTTVLNRILHAGTKFWIEAEMGQIKEAARTYVDNESFDTALELLKKHHYVIISGIPGIGKTTLARMLIWRMLATGEYEELVYVNGELDEAVAMLQEGKKQILFYDDFLGSNVFEKGDKDFEKKLFLLIDRVVQMPDTLFIMTTREYVLSQAKEHYERFKINNVEVAKCMLDMGAYSPAIRAKILRNHILEANLPSAIMRQLAEKENYMRIVTHEYFSPRVIEAYLDKGVWRNVPEEEFMSKFIEMFDNPTLVWETAFEKISEEARYALMVLCTMGVDIPASDWYKAYKNLCPTVPTERRLKTMDVDWRNIMKELSECFALIEPMEGGGYYVKLFNPSVTGFVTQYIQKSEDTQRLLIEGALYVEQLYAIFTNVGAVPEYFDGWVVVGKDMSRLVEQRMLELMQKGSSYQYLLRKDGEYNKSAKMEILSFYSSHFFCQGFLEKILTKEDLTSSEVSLRTRLEMMTGIDWSEVDFTCDEVIESILKEKISVDDYVRLIDVLAYACRMSITRSDRFLNQLQRTIRHEIDSNSIYASFTLHGLKESVRQIGQRLPHEDFDAKRWMGEIDAKIKEAEPLEFDLDGVNMVEMDWQEVNAEEAKAVDAIMEGVKLGSE